jgi:hypothetical protein
VAEVLLIVMKYLPDALLMATLFIYCLVILGWQSIDLVNLISHILFFPGIYCIQPYRYH